MFLKRKTADFTKQLGLNKPVIEPGLTFSILNLHCAGNTAGLKYVSLYDFVHDIISAVLQGDPKMYKHDPVLFVLPFVAILEPLSFYFDSIFFGFSSQVVAFHRSRYNLVQSYQSVINTVTSRARP